MNEAYVVEDKVGQGTFGEVFKARPRGPVDRGERVALKKVLMKNEKEGFPITALREIKILKQLKHPHVLAVKEIVYSEAGDHDQGSIFLVFEFMEHDLGGLLNRPVRFSGPEIMCLTKQLLEGLNYIHLNRIMHRDMKAANLLLNNRGILKIADFGLARGCEKVNSRYTATVCTRWYRPPEILLGERRYTTAIDVWGVGCILAELFVGHPILQGGRRDAKTEMDNDLDQYLEICKVCSPCTATPIPFSCVFSLLCFLFVPSRHTGVGVSAAAISFVALLVPRIGQATLHFLLATLLYQRWNISGTSTRPLPRRNCEASRRRHH